MEKKISPIRYGDFRIKYILKSKVPVKGSDEMLSLEGYLNTFIWSLAGLLAFLPYVMYANHFSPFVKAYIIIITVTAIFRPVGYLTYRISFYRFYRYYDD